MLVEQSLESSSEEMPAWSGVFHVGISACSWGDVVMYVCMYALLGLNQLLPHKQAEAEGGLHCSGQAGPWR